MTRIFQNVHQRSIILPVLLLLLYCYIFFSDQRTMSFGNRTQKHDISVKMIIPSQSHQKRARENNWNNQQLVEMCDSLRRDPRPFTSDCKREEQTMKCRGGPNRYAMFSQFHQDFFLFKNHFNKMKTPGIYLDIAANDPYRISNTFFFDRCLNWSGICVEANDFFLEPLYRKRSCDIVPTCVGSVDGQVVDFRLSYGASGIVGSTYKSMDKMGQLKEKGQKVETKEMRCTTMKSVLGRVNVNVIDYLSLDVEGHELEVLKGFDFENVIIKVMTIEVTGSNMSLLREFLESKGYQHHSVDYSGNIGKTIPGLLKEDAIFLHSSVTFGAPE